MTTPTYTFNLLASFDGPDGILPNGGLIEDSQGDLFGTANQGGDANNDGTVFEIKAGTGQVTVLATFNGSDGRFPEGGLVVDSQGDLFGTTAIGGGSNNGTVFEIAAGTSTITTLASFNNNNGTQPTSGLVEDSQGNLYGTTSAGGTSGAGTVFEIAAGTGTITTLFAFDEGANGGAPEGGLTIDSAGDIFGTTVYGGANSAGTAFEIKAGTHTLTTLASFTSGNNTSYALVEDAQGNLYGTTALGGANGDGTVFEIVKGSGTVTTLATFSNATGAYLQGSLVMDSAGDLFGTTVTRGAYGYGTVFEIVKGSGTVTTLYNFNGPNGGYGNGATLLFDSAGDLFGERGTGGPGGQGTIFELAYVPPAPTITGTVAGQTTTSEAVIRPFAGVTIDDPSYNSGADATDTLTITLGGTGGTLTGTGLSGVTNGVYTLSGDPATITSELQALNFTPTAGPGSGTQSTTTFTLSDVGSAYATPTVDSTTSVTDIDPGVAPTISVPAADDSIATTSAAPVTPFAGVTLGDTNYNPTDTLTITLGGAGGTLSGPGLSGTNGTYTLTGTTATVQSELDALTFTPSAPQSGTHYTTTFTLSDTSSAFATPTTNNVVTVVDTEPAVAPMILVNASSYTISTVATFNATTGAYPFGGMIADSAGNLFGTTSSGPSGGTVFEIVKGSGTVTTLAWFSGTNGTYPSAGLIEDGAGNLYGTSVGGGAFHAGTVFEIVKGSGTVATLASFNVTDGLQPERLIADNAGNLYGTTGYGGASGDGTVFEVVKGSGTVTTLATFNGDTGQNPFTGIIEDSVGNLYGTTYAGGASNDGTIFELLKGSDTVTTLASFNGADGRNPVSGLVADSAGNLYGITRYGGAYGLGTVFEIAAGSGTITPVVSFADGTDNYGNLFVDGAGNLFGTRVGDGASGYGTVFEIIKGSGTITTLRDVTDGGYGTPSGGLTADSAGNLYGTIAEGGTNNDGTVFELSPVYGPVQTTSEAPVAPFAGDAITDANANATDTLTITMSGTGGTLSGTGLTGGANGVYTLTGSAATVTTELQALSFTPTGGQANTTWTTTFTLSDLSSADATPSVASTSVVDTDPAVAPTIAGTVANQTTTSSLAPFAHVTIGDANAGGSETLTITLNGGGTLSGSGLSGGTNGVYTLSGSAATVTSELDALTFTPTPGPIPAATTFTLSDLSSAYTTPTTDSTTKVTDIMTSVSNPGSKDGANSMEPGQAGANGAAGNTAVAYSTPATRAAAVDTSDPNYAADVAAAQSNPNNTVLAGVSPFNAGSSPTPATWGGNGGNGYGAGNSAITGTAAGSGGAGGSATAKAVTNAAYSGSYATVATAFGYGGNGGNGGTPGFATPAKGTKPGTLAKGGAGGVGGAASASAQDTNTGSTEANATAIAVGGNGGSGTDAAGGNGATAAATATAVKATGSYSATAFASATGGSGGNGTKGAGGVGASVTLANAVAGATNGDLLTLGQIAKGGAGGSSQGAAAGAAGSATSTLTFDDRAGNNSNGKASGSIPALVSQQISGGSTAVGGAGGGATGSTLTAAAGGAATATATLAGAGIRFGSTAQGGAGGSGYAPAVPGGNSGGAGGKATASLTATNTQTSAGNVNNAVAVRASANGGNGGNSSYAHLTQGLPTALAGGSGGVGGGAAANLKANVASVSGPTNSFDNYGTSFDDIFGAFANGGAGGLGDGFGKSGGAGGVGTASVLVTGKSAVASRIEVAVRATGGRGGNGEMGGSGGAGAATKLSTTIASGLTTGGSVFLVQTALGGAGGAAHGGTAGVGGAATSTDSLTDATSEAIYGAAQAFGGNGGAGYGISFTSAGTNPTTTYKYSAGAAGGNATATTTAVGAIGNNNYFYYSGMGPGWGAGATGGDGGSAYGAATGGAGGAGTATATGTSTVKTSTLRATAGGGAGGTNHVGTLGKSMTGNGGAGGAATATAKGTTSATGTMAVDLLNVPQPGQLFFTSDIQISATATGGAGGLGNGAGHKGGAGGAATATATGVSSVSGKKTKTNGQYVSTPGSVVQTAATATGGAGGVGKGGAAGGVGGAAIVNSPTGSTAKGGILALTEKAFGGAGGDSYGSLGVNAGNAGAGGAATTNLTIANAGYTRGYAYSKGGAGGLGAARYGGAAGAGGAAIANVAITATRAADYAGGFGTAALQNGPYGPGVAGYAKAVGGTYGVGGPQATPPTGGNATATTKVTGPGFIAANANASSGEGGYLSASGNNLSGIQHVAGTATATATGVGYKGFANAVANSFTGGVVQRFYAAATADIEGNLNTTTKATTTATGVAFGQITYNAAIPALSTSYQSIASIVALPTIASVANITKAGANSNIATAFDKTTGVTYFAAGEIGGSHDTGHANADHQSQTVSLQIDPTQLPSGDLGDLVLGLYGGTVPANMTAFSLTVSLTLSDGTVTKPVNITDLAQAQATFTNNAIDLGPILTDANDYVTSVSITMNETFSGTGSFFGQFLLGDPPAASSAPNAHVGALASALFDGFFGSPGTDAGTASHIAPSAPPIVAGASDLLGSHRNAHA